jgi:hypothetical protein
VDAGANIGLVSIPVAQLLKDRGGVVHAFEVQRMMCTNRHSICRTCQIR